MRVVIVGVNANLNVGVFSRGVYLKIIIRSPRVIRSQCRFFFFNFTVKLSFAFYVIICFFV